MKIHRILLPALLSLAGMNVVSCTSTTVETRTAGKVEKGVPGGEFARTSTVSATVTGIDAPRRRVTLVTPEGKKFTVKAGPEVVNFNQIQTGDQLKATLTDEIIVRMAKPGEKTGDSAAAMAGLAPVGAKPGAVTGETYQVTATVAAIDEERHTATLRFSDGSSKTIPVRSDVDLSRHKVGQKVIIQATETFAIRFEKP